MLERRLLPHFANFGNFNCNETGLDYPSISRGALAFAAVHPRLLKSAAPPLVFVARLSES